MAGHWNNKAIFEVNCIIRQIILFLMIPICVRHWLALDDFSHELLSHSPVVPLVYFVQSNERYEQDNVTLADYDWLIFSSKAASLENISRVKYNETKELSAQEINCD